MSGNEYWAEAVQSIVDKMPMTMCHNDAHDALVAALPGLRKYLANELRLEATAVRLPDLERAHVQWGLRKAADYLERSPHRYESSPVEG